MSAAGQAMNTAIGMIPKRARLAVWRLGITAFVGGSFAWSLGMFPPFGSGFVRADENLRQQADHEKTHQEIRQQLNGLKQGLAGLQKSVDDSAAAREAAEKASAVRQIRRQIYDTERDACRAKEGQLRDFLMQQARDLRADFMTLTGKEYPAVDCSAYR